MDVSTATVCRHATTCRLTQPVATDRVLDSQEGVAQDCSRPTRSPVTPALVRESDPPTTTFRFFRVTVTEAGTGGGQPTSIAELELLGRPPSGPGSNCQQEALELTSADGSMTCSRRNNGGDANTWDMCGQKTTQAGAEITCPSLCAAESAFACTGFGFLGGTCHLYADSSNCGSADALNWYTCESLAGPAVPPPGCAEGNPDADLTVPGKGHANSLSSWASGYDGYAPANAFDNDAGTLWENQNGGEADYLVYEFKRPTQIEGYSVVGYEPWCHDAPRAWVLEGSPDGSSWTTLDTQEGVPQDCSAANRRTIAPATYRMYRIHITAGGAADGVEDAVASVAEFELFGEC